MGDAEVIEALAEAVNRGDPRRAGTLFADYARWHPPARGLG